LENETREILIIAGLLHDIGKFSQRADITLFKEYKELERYCCKSYSGRYSHHHVLYSGQFIKCYFPKEWSNVENIVLYHHNPDNAPDEIKYLAKIITLADWLSSGERRDKPDEESLGNPRKDPLLSIFSKITKENRESEKNESIFHPLVALRHDISQIYPIEKEKAVTDQSYKNLWEDFISDFSKLDFTKSYKVILSQLYSLLEKYTLFIPSSSYKTEPDISLYHHSKTTAAIAVGLFDLKLSETEVDTILKSLSIYFDLAIEYQKQIFYMLRGDISGIQDFIYSITSSKSLKSLKGRSLYLQLLSDVIANKILIEFDLPPMNLILSAGGNIQLLIPAIDNFEEKIANVKKEVNEKLLIAHNGKLSVAFAFQPLSAKDFSRDKFVNIWIKLSNKLLIEKQRKFSNLIINENSRIAILGPFEKGGEKKGCEVCGEELLESELNECSLCNSFSELAIKFSRASYIEITQTNPEPLSNSSSRITWSSVLESMGSKYNFLSKPTNPDDSYRINSTDFLEESLCIGFVFFAKYISLQENNNLITLEDLAKRSEGIDKWGVLRGDVDDLGYVFVEGLREEKTISRLSMLSYLISLFFTGRIENIVKNSEFKDRIYISYAGGDDFLIVSSWSTIPFLAQIISHEFQSYTCNNLSLSTGMFIAPSDKYPIHQASISAGEALEESKNNEGKHSFTFLRRTIKWEEYAFLQQIKDSLVGLIQENVPRSILNSILWACGEQEKVEQGEIPIERIWRLLYSLKRLKERFGKKREDLIQKITSLETNIITNYSLKPNLDLAVRWADFLTRKEGK